jgi:small-conductance mechanosensitive channel
LVRQDIASWTVPLIVFSVATLFALAFREVILRSVTGRAQPYVLEAIRFPSILWCLAIGLTVAIQNASSTPAFEYWAGRAIAGFLTVSISLAVAAVAVRMVTGYGERHRLPFAVAGLSRTLIYIFILSISLLMLLSEFNVRITPILTALGVGGLAVALALQDTLANFFAGIHILVEEPISVGDFIELSERDRGTVLDIGWRTTRILTSANSVIVIPNQKITSGILINHNLPNQRVAAEVIMNAAHRADPEHIVAVALEAASSLEGVLSEPAPVVLFDPGVQPTHLSLKLVAYVGSMTQRGPVQSALRKRIYEGFVREGIPFPEVRS